MDDVIEPDQKDKPTETSMASALIANALAGADAFHLARLASKQGRSILHVCQDASRAEELQRLLHFIDASLNVIVMPAWDCLPYDRASPGAEVMALRLHALKQLAAIKPNRASILLTTVNSVIQRVPSAEAIQAGEFTGRAGKKLDREALLAFLANHGYQRTGMVMERGEYSIRGGVIDLFPNNRETPLRIDLFGNDIETIRAFDPLTQRSLEKISQFTLGPLSEVMQSPQSSKRFVERYLKMFGAVTGDPLLEAVQAGRSFPGMEHWLPLFHENMATLFDYMPENAVIGFDHLADQSIAARLETIAEHHASRMKPEYQGEDGQTYRALDPIELYLDEQSLGVTLQQSVTYKLSLYARPEVAPSGISELDDLGARPARDFARERADKSVNLFDAIVQHVKAVKPAERMVIAAMTRGSAERVQQILKDHGGDPPLIVSRLNSVKPGKPAIAVLPVERGFLVDDLQLLSEQDLLGTRMSMPPARRKKAENFINDVGTLKTGDLVVHVDHGIGRFEGLEAIDIANAPHDCLRLIYLGGDKLFVPVENLDVLSRYGSAEQAATLDKLGGAAWQSRKARIKQRIKELADELIRLAAERQARRGEAIQSPEGIYDEFAARFPFEETADQLASIEAVLADLGSGRPMDRLLCGDVGFGKTEVALRAAFVAAMSGKQVAVLAPTTLLARQHFRVFSERFEGLPIKLGHLSRFVTGKDAKATKEGVANGTVDIVIGTHAILGKSVEFKNLGLAVVDEEQHFGVVHKERLKNMRAQVHVLTMTATPIPRTLHMALGGLRDLSIIATPPVDRLAVRSFVMPYDSVAIREALLREHHRGGQSFYVCPRISDQPRLTEQLGKLVPELRLGVANGRMSASDIETVMGAFYDRKLDVLLATNIIESGLDIPSANTMIIHRADMFGLSQLYQLRGRVGRSKVRGYAYFTVPADRKLHKMAERRLSVIQSLEGLGAGFQLASHDLDIRGAGNLLGDEQSGQIKEVGFELYNQMLEEAVAALKAVDEPSEAEAKTGWTPQISIDAAAMMPESYVGDLDLRLQLYRRLAGLEDRESLDAFASELVDRFGSMPAETEQLLAIVGIKQLCRKANIARLDAGPKGLVIAFRDNEFGEPAKLVDFIGKSRGRIKIRPDHRLFVQQLTTSPGDRLNAARKVAGEISALLH